MLGGGIYPGMITATVGTALFVAVVLTSIVIARRRLRYEAWYAVHLAAYAAIALAWFHQIPTGNELVLDRVAADYWRALYAATLALLVGFRVVTPLAGFLRHRLRVAEVIVEGPGVVSIRIEGRRLDRLEAQAGQFFLWRFLARGRWGRRIRSRSPRRPTGARCVSRSRRSATTLDGSRDLRVGTRVLAEGPFGVVRPVGAAAREGAADRGRIGITPVRALLEELHGDVVVLYRVVTDDDASSASSSTSSRARTASGSTTSSATTRREREPTCSRPPTCARSSPTSPTATSSSAGRRR